MVHRSLKKVRGRRELDYLVTYRSKNIVAKNALRNFPLCPRYNQSSIVILCLFFDLSLARADINYLIAMHNIVPYILCIFTSSGYHQSLSHNAYLL